MMLPFTMWAAYSWSTVLLSAVFAFLMLGIDEIGVQIEVGGRVAVWPVKGGGVWRQGTQAGQARQPKAAEGAAAILDLKPPPIRPGTREKPAPLGTCPMCPASSLPQSEHHPLPSLLQEPFGVLPIEAYCQTIERNIRELLSRNYDITLLVLRQNYPIGSTALEPTSGTDASSSVGIGGEDEFGEMMGAAGPSKEHRGIAGGSNVVSLTASAAGGAVPSRRVHFAEDAGGSPIARVPAAAAPARDMVEIELGSPSDMAPLMASSVPRSSYAATWLQQ